jgi:hypothetical protein
MFITPNKIGGYRYIEHSQPRSGLNDIALLINIQPVPGCALPRIPRIPYPPVTTGGD